MVASDAIDQLDAAVSGRCAVPGREPDASGPGRWTSIGGA